MMQKLILTISIICGNQLILKKIFTETPSVEFHDSDNKRKFLIYNDEKNNLDIVYENKTLCKLGQNTNCLYLNLKNELNLKKPIINQWYILEIDTFDQLVKNWSYDKRGSCGESSKIILGGHCNLGGNKNVMKKYYNLPAHSFVKLEGAVDFINNWEDETLIIEIDDQPYYSKSHNWCNSLYSICSKHKLNQCGTNESDLMNHNFRIVIPHTKNELKVYFKTTLGNKDKCIASWGIDNVILYIK